MNLYPGEIVCDKCDGKGDFGMKVSINEMKLNGHFIKVPGKLVIEECDKCHGSGKLDWIEVIVGKKNPNVITLSKRKYPKLLAKDLINIQPMTMGFKYGI